MTQKETLGKRLLSGATLPLSLMLVFSVLLFSGSGCGQTSSNTEDKMMNAEDSEMMGNDMMDDEMMHSTNTDMMENEGMMKDDMMKDDMMKDGMMEGDMMHSEVDQTIKLSGKNFLFLMDGMENPTLRVKKGEKVRVEFMSESGLHDFVVDELNAKTDRVRDGETTAIEFTPEQTGEFEYYCGVGQHRANGMKGKIIVE